MNARLVSCILPTFNSQAYLREALDSISAQTYHPIEIIVADDGSSDQTRQMAQSYEHALNWVEQNSLGPAATRNLGLRAAHGEFVSWLDPDDLWHPEKLARQMACFDAREDLQACITHVQILWTDPATAKRYQDHPRSGPVPGYATISLLARRTVFDLVGDFDTSLWFSDAADWFLRAAERGVVLQVLPDALVYHRMHGANLTRRREELSRHEFLKLVKASLDRRRARLSS